MEYTVFSLIYLATAVLSFLVAFLAMQRRTVVGAKELFWTALAAAVCTTFLCFESASATVTEKFFFSKLSYIGVVTIPVFYLLFVLRFTTLIRLKDMKQGWMLFFIPFITLIFAWTNEKHHLIWSGYSPISETTNILTYEHGLWFWIGYAFYSYMLLAVASYYLFIFICHHKYKKAFRNQGWLVAVAGFCPWVVSAFYLSGLNPVKGLDITPISTTGCNILFTIAILKSRFLNIVPVAREVLMETLPVGVIALDDQNRIQDINPMARMVLGIQTKDILGSTLTQVGSSASPAFLEALVSLDDFAQIEEIKETCFRSFSIVKRPVKALRGSRLITINDITEQISKERELIEAKKRAEESDRLKSAFLANMSHEIRTPMNCIMGFVSVMQQENLTGEERNEFLEIIKSSGQRLLTTLTGLIDISKIEAGQTLVAYSVFDVNEILYDLYKMFRAEAVSKGLELIPSDPVPYNQAWIRSDKEKLYSVASNLVKNALKYTNSGFVKYHCSVNEERMLCFSVTDSGIGIPPEKQELVFDRFVQIDASRNKTYEGSGLGLAISKSFIEMLGGKIQIESEEGAGSVFSVFLPLE
jgi:signal transduction histidine kinase